ncbi:MAG: hypothetical protein K5639_03350 [Eubacterium sp.]|nr:hypothetical protein [Eubacterium sp.]
MKGLKLRYKIPIIVAIVVTIVLLLWFVFKIDTVTVEGNTFFSNNEVEQTYSSKWWQKNMLTYFIFNKLGADTDPEYVRESEVTFPEFRAVHIKIYEKSILAGVKYANHYIYFDKDGMVLETTDKPKDGIAYFVSDDITDFSLYQTISTGRQDLLSQMINLAGRLTYYKIDWDTVEIDKEGKATLKTDKVSVLLGRKNDYDEVLSVLPDVLKTAVATKKKGEIDLTNYKPGATIIFKKK